MGALSYNFKTNSTHFLRQMPINMLGFFKKVLSGGVKLSNMEELFEEFPPSAKQIFEELDNRNLAKCRTVCKSWQKFIDDENIVWNRILMKFPSGDGLNLWKLDEENRLINKALNLEWKYGDRKWDFDRHFNVVFVIGTINVFEIIWPKTNLDGNEKVLDRPVASGGAGGARNPPDGAEVDMQLLQEEDDEENLQSERFQKWEREPESFISKKSQYKRKRLEWMKIRSLCSKMPGQEKYLEVSHCGKLLTVQGSRHGRTEMHVAAMTGQTKVFQTMLEEADDKNPTDDNYDTPLHLAAKGGHYTICKLIIDAGVSDKNPSNRSDETPLELATSNNHSEVGLLFLDSAGV